MTVSVFVTKDRIKRRVARLERALKDALEVARHTFPQDEDGHILPIDRSQWTRLKLWDKYVRALRVSEKRLPKSR